MSVRPPQRVAMAGVVAVSAYGQSAVASPLHVELVAARALDESRSKMVDIAQAYVDSPGFLVRLDRLPPAYVQFDQWVASRGTRLSLPDVSAAATSLFGMPASGLVSSQAYQDTRQSLGAGVVAATIVRNGTRQARPQLMRGIRLM